MTKTMRILRVAHAIFEQVAVHKKISYEIFSKVVTKFQKSVTKFLDGAWHLKNSIWQH